MAHHTLTLNYNPDGFRPDTDPLLVKTGDTISFQLGIAPASSTFKITMNKPGSFSPAEVADSATTITVLETAITTYDCQLFDASGSLLSGNYQTGGGGHVRPG